MKCRLLTLALLWLAALAQPALATDTVYYYYTDALHSTVVQADAQGNIVEQSTHYAPYGQVLNRSMRDGPGYTGHEEDPSTGLNYMQQRYFDSQSGRFLSTDPVLPTDDGRNFNRYWYANDNPYRYADPDGRESGCVTLQVNCFNSGATLAQETGTLLGVTALLAGGLLAPEMAPVIIAGASRQAVTEAEKKAGEQTAKKISAQAARGIRSLEKEIAKHLKKIAEFKKNPTVRPGMEDMPKDAIQRQQQRRIEHWQKEIETFKKNIQKLKDPPPPPPPPPRGTSQSS